MIKLIFRMGREVFNVYVDGEEIWYSDRKWEKGIRCIPKDELFIKKVKFSRNALPDFLLDLFTLTEEEEKQYEENKHSEDKLADQIIKDVKKIGGELVKRE